MYKARILIFNPRFPSADVESAVISLGATTKEDAQAKIIDIATRGFFVDGTTYYPPTRIFSITMTEEKSGSYRDRF